MRMVRRMRMEDGDGDVGGAGEDGEETKKTQTVRIRKLSK